MHAREKRILCPPRTEMRGSAFGIAFVAREAEGSREQREVVHAREFPDLLHVPRDVLGAMVDIEAIVELRSPPSAQRIEEPVWVLHVSTQNPEQLPPPGQYLFGRCDHPSTRLVWNGLQRLFGWKGPKLGIPSGIPGSPSVFGGAESQ